MPENKEYVSVSKGKHKQKLCILQKSFKLARIMNCFQRKTPRYKFGFSKFCALRPKWCVLAGSKMTQSVCVCNAHRNVVLPVDTMKLDLPYKDLIKKIVYNPESNNCIMHRCESCPDTATLKEFLDQELKVHENDEKFNYYQWDTTYRAILTAFTTPYEE